MLQELSIRNFAIIEDLTIRFQKGLTILSGETGAGKSIIINAVNLLLGSRVSPGLIRTGADSAELEALFEVPEGSRVAERMREQGYDPTEGLLVRRILSTSDRHRIYINGRLATMQVLGAVTAHLASISGQHAHQGLLREEEHLNILDQFGGLMPLRETYYQCFQEIVPLLRREQELLRRQNDQQDQIDLLRYQLNEIEAAAILPDEDQTLEKERLRLKNSELLLQTVQTCVDVLYNRDGALVESLGQMSRDLARAGRVDDRLASAAAAMEELTYRSEDLATGLRDYLRGIDLDPRQLEQVEARLDLLTKIKRKYGGTAASLEGVAARRQEIKARLDDVENLDEALNRVRGELKQTHTRLCALADELSAGRRRAADLLAQKAEAELHSLRMGDARFAVDLQGLPAAKESGPYLSHKGAALTESGTQRAVFMIAPNVGETIKPLAAIASGGELSRVVLALKAILARNDALETIVFDEVDAGIGGGTAEVVGRKLVQLADGHQILCITHLPQIAKFGDHHFRIQKSVAKGRTRTVMRQLEQRERVEEIARMLGGERITETTLAHARELLGLPVA